jgi:quinol monooxygenase YgiN
MGTEVWLMIEAAVKPGRLDDLRAVMDELVESTTDESGTLTYAWSVDEDGASMHLLERYADPGAATAHLATFVSRFAERYFAAVDPVRFVVYGGDDTVAEAVAAAHPTFMGPLTGLVR